MMLAETADTGSSLVPALWGAVGTILTALFAAVIAMRYWKRQQFLTQQHEIAYRFIHKAILLREQFWQSRSMLLTPGEVESLRKKYEITDDQIEELKASGHDPMRRVGYLGRYWDLQKVYVDLQAISYELETLLGDKYRDCLAPIRKQLVELNTSIHLILDPEHMRSIHGNEITKLRRVVSGSREMEDDIFGGEFESTINSVIQDVRQFLLVKRRSIWGYR